MGQAGLHVVSSPPALRAMGQPGGPTPRKAQPWTRDTRWEGFSPPETLLFGVLSH